MDEVLQTGRPIKGLTARDTPELICDGKRKDGRRRNRRILVKILTGVELRRGSDGRGTFGIKLALSSTSYAMALCGWVFRLRAHVRYTRKHHPVQEKASSGTPESIIRHRRKHHPVHQQTLSGTGESIIRYAKQRLPVQEKASSGRPESIIRYTKQPHPVQQTAIFTELHLGTSDMCSRGRSPA